MFRAVVFTFAPTLVELVLVCGLLSRNFNPVLTLIVLATFLVYVSWTVFFTSRAAKLRKEVNRLDNLATGATTPRPRSPAPPPPETRHFQSSNKWPMLRRQVA